MDTQALRQARDDLPAATVFDIGWLSLDDLDHLPESALIAALRRAIRDADCPSARYSCHAAGPSAATEY